MEFSNLPVVWGYTGKSGITQEGLKYAISKDKDGALTISKPLKEIKFKKGIAE